MVNKPSASIVWTLDAKQDLKDILSYYKRKSPKGFQLVKDAIMAEVKAAAHSPDIFKADILKTDNKGEVRVFVVYHTRVTYQKSSKGITILRLRHTSREPNEF
jgi:plasmid stabilization system protein ParE